jgi:ankyrin repeat protein
MREAISGGHLAIVEHLVEVHRVNLHAGRPDSGSLPHNYAASLGQLEIVKYLVSCGSGLCVQHGSSAAWKERHNDPETDSFVLRSACESGNLDLVKFVLSEGCDVNAPDPVNGGTPLECACASGDLGIVKLLHGHGARVSVSRTCDCCLDWTPIHEAVATGAADIVDFLMRTGSSQINTQCTGKDRITPLDLAFEMDQMECAKVLFCHGAVLYCNRAQHELRQQFIR